MAGQGVPGLGKDHGPGHIRGSAPEFAIDKVAQTTQTETHRNDRGDEIGNIEEVAPDLAGKEEHGNQHADKATMEGHPPSQIWKSQSGSLRKRSK